MDMPSWPVHIALGNKLNQRLKLGNDFILGNVIPDCLNGYVIECNRTLSHKITHYCFDGDFKSRINLDRFYDEYKGRFDNPIILGYYVHLFTDSYFNEYFRKHYVFNEGSDKICVLRDGSFCKDTPWKLKQADFKTFGKYLIKNNMIGHEVGMTAKTMDYLKALPFEIDDIILKKVICKINESITEQVSSDFDYLVFNERELNDVFEGCYEEILKRIG